MVIKNISNRNNMTTVKPIIIAIVGASGSGKTTLSMYLYEKCQIPHICSYTTRPMRENEINGREHWFVSMTRPIPPDPLAYTYFGGHHYWAEHKQVSKDISTYVVDEKGLKELKDKWSDRYDIVSIYIQRPFYQIDECRQKRDEDRIKLEDEYYDAKIINFGCKNDFCEHGENVIKMLIFKTLLKYVCTKTNCSHRCPCSRL